MSGKAISESSPSSIEESYQTFHRDLTDQLVTLVKSRMLQDGDEDYTLQGTLEELIAYLSDPKTDLDLRNAAGQRLLSFIVSRFQDIMPHVPRDLFWYFGGDCLHFLGDDEIQSFQDLEDSFYEQLTAEHPVEYHKLRNALLPIRSEVKH